MGRQPRVSRAPVGRRLPLGRLSQSESGAYAHPRSRSLSIGSGHRWWWDNNRRRVDGNWGAPPNRFAGVLMDCPARTFVTTFLGNSPIFPMHEWRAQYQGSVMQG